MIGGPPIMQVPQFAPQQPMVAAPPRFPTGQVAGAPGPAPQPAAPHQPLPPPSTVRSQAPDEPAERRPPTPLVLPSPEQLGIKAVPTAYIRIDWTETHRRLDQLGVTCFHVDKLPNGGCKVICLLPSGQPGHSRRFEADAANQAEALQLVLDQAEQWARRN
jgi:hypothetical protein